MKAVTDKYIIQTVSRALDLLEQFRESGTELGLTDLGSRMKLQKNNVFRLVATLKAKKYLELNNSTGKYRLGIMTRALGQVATRHINYVSQARQFLIDLKLQSHETSYFSALRDGYAHYFDGVESDLPVRVAHRIGGSFPPHCTAAGRVQLAFMDPQKQAHLLASYETNRFTDDTTTDKNALQSELKKVAHQGYAIDEEHDTGVIEIAAPVFDSSGAVIGAISIVGPEMRFSATRLTTEIIPVVCLTASRLSAVLGHSNADKTSAQIGQQPSKPLRRAKPRTAKPYIFGGRETCC